MHEQHLLAVRDCLWRYVPTNCWQRSEAPRIGSFLYVLKLTVSTWSDEHSSGHRCIIIDLFLMSAPAEVWISWLCGEVDLS